MDTCATWPWLAGNEPARRPWHLASTPDTGPGVTSHLSDEAAMQRFASGDENAFAPLYLRHRERLHRYTLRLAGRVDEAEELFQEVWAAVVRGRAGFRDGMRFAPWLYAIAHRRAADRWRVLGRHAPDWRDGAVDDDLHGLESHAAVAPESRAHADALACAINAAVERLPLPQREAFLLRAEGDLSLDEIAAITGAGTETVKSRLRYAQARLRKALEAWR